MADFNFVTPRLATGAAVNNETDVEALVAAGITHIIDCRGEFDDTPLLATHPAVMYLWNGTDDDGQTKPVEWFAKSFNFALPALALPHTKCYAHCAAGVNRGPSTCYAIMRAQGWGSVAAISLIRTARPQAAARYSKDADIAVQTLGYT